MIAQGVLHGGCLTATDICCARHSASPAGLALCSRFSKVKNLVVSNSLCTFAVIFRWDILLKKSYKPIIIN